MKDINKHTKFEELINDQLNNFEYQIDENEWKVFESRYKDELPRKKPIISRIKEFFNLKNVILVSSVLVNTLVIILIILPERDGAKSAFKRNIVSANHNSRSYRYNDERIGLLEEQIDELTEKFSMINKEKLIVKKINIEDQLEADGVTNNKSEKEQYTVGDIITPAENKETISEKYADQIIHPESSKAVYLYNTLNEPPMFKDKKGEFHYIIDLRSYVNSEFIPSNVSKSLNKSSTSYLSFIIRKDGSISDIKTVIEFDPEIDKEIMRILTGMSYWKPGLNFDGDTVDTAIEYIFKIEIDATSPFPNF